MVAGPLSKLSFFPFKSNTLCCVVSATKLFYKHTESKTGLKQHTLWDLNGFCIHSPALFRITCIHSHARSFAHTHTDTTTPSLGLTALRPLLPPLPLPSAGTVPNSICNSKFQKKSTCKNCRNMAFKTVTIQKQNKKKQKHKKYFFFCSPKSFSSFFSFSYIWTTFLNSIQEGLWTAVYGKRVYECVSMCIPVHSRVGLMGVACIQLVVRGWIFAGITWLRWSAVLASTWHPE